MIIDPRERLYVPDAENIRSDILAEAYTTPYSIHLGATKMYRDLKLHYWWPNMTGIKASRNLITITYPQVKMGKNHDEFCGEIKLKLAYFIPGQLSKFLPLVEFAHNNSYQATIGMAPCEALYDRKRWSPVYWDKVGERKLLGPDMVREMAEVVTQIRQRMETAQNRQKSYAN
ncbi:uncharacterized protein LOC111381395 [Olea europaea var. sylvestris]|uniref:uncharacterized protein LOC111381395 n=1 Tax=Olea europaea var. sylvestris TaxID=158386 RepID=UPI000C1D3301|nr:uncharacterized protein LOC111381395 [Olea europaea var. sylvestris]